MADLERNKQTVLAFYTLAFSDKHPAAAAAKYVGAEYIQHNPQVANGAEAFIQFVTGVVTHWPQLRVEIKRVVAEGDLVVLHSHFKASPEDRGTAVVDLFRLQDGKLVEHWDVVQVVPETAANDNTMF